MLLSNHSTPIPNRILTPTKSQSKYSTFCVHALMSNNYLIPISVPILPHTTPQDRIILHSTNILTILCKQHLTFSPHTIITTYSSSLSLTQPHPKHPLHYTITLFIKLPMPCQPDTHTNPPYIHIHTHNSPIHYTILLTIIVPYNK